MKKIEQVRAEMVKALKAGDTERKEALSMLLSALKAKFIDKREDLTEAEENEVVQKEIKQIKETLVSAKGRAEIERECEARLMVLSEFAPVLMDEAQIKLELGKILKELGIAKPTSKDRGAIMKTLMPRLKGKADSSQVSKVVEEAMQ